MKIHSPKFKTLRGFIGLLLVAASVLGLIVAYAHYFWVSLTSMDPVAVYMVHRAIVAEELLCGIAFIVGFFLTIV